MIFFPLRARGHLLAKWGDMMREGSPYTRYPPHTRRLCRGDNNQECHSDTDTGEGEKTADLLITVQAFHLPRLSLGTGCRSLSSLGTSATQVLSLTSNHPRGDCGAGGWRHDLNGGVHVVATPLSVLTISRHCQHGHELFMTGLLFGEGCAMCSQ